MTPRGWAVTTLGEFVPLEYGKSLPEVARTHGPFQVIGSSGVVGTHSQALTTGSAIVVGRKGNVGRAYLSRGPCWPIDTAYFYDSCGDADLRFRYYLIKSQALKALDKSTAVPSLSRDDYDRVQVHIPPESEQRRIVDELEKYLSRLDDAEASLMRARAKLLAYSASVLKAAVEGRLVPTEAELARAETRGYEPADILLNRILGERRCRWEQAELEKRTTAGKAPTDDRWKLKYRDPESVREIGLPPIPQGWCWTTLDQLAWSARDGPHYSPAYVDRGIPFVTGGQVRPWGVDFSRAKRISEEVHRELSKRVRPEPGDLLYTKGGTTGIARVNTYSEPFSVWVHVAVLKLTPSVNPFYLQHALNSPWCFAQAQRFTHGVGNQDLGLTRMIKILIPLPPRAEQDRVVEEIDRLDSVARSATASLESIAQRSIRLRQSILRAAVFGKLVDQDPNDEPAAKFLERIRSERTSSTAAKKTRGRKAKASR